MNTARWMILAGMLYILLVHNLTTYAPGAREEADGFVVLSLGLGGVLFLVFRNKNSS